MDLNELKIVGFSLYREREMLRAQMEQLARQEQAVNARILENENAIQAEEKEIAAEKELLETKHE